jgi:CheY-like chemotaxis protein/DNA-binding XRE family transcriptional regulator
MSLAKRARLATGLSLELFAKFIGADLETYKAWESGTAKPSRTVLTLLRLIEADPTFCLTTLRQTKSKLPAGTILLVVANDEARSTLWDVCNEEGFDVEAVVDGREAIEWLKGNDTPCAIVVDVTIPLINGWQLLSWLRQQQERLACCPVITMSSDPMHSEHAAKEHGVARHFAKPIDVQQILDTIREHCKSAA